MTQNAVQKTSIDWFRLRTKSTVSDTVSAIRPMLGDLAPLLHHRPIERGGSLGFKYAEELYLGQVKIGRFDYGGESQLGWGRLDISGAGCSRLDWSDLHSLESLERPEIRRLDIAHTTENGEVNHEYVVASHAAGRFITGGRPPDLREIISTNDTAGRTCYIGTREKSPKFMRCYEKGWQMLASFPRHIREAEVTIGGVHPSQIYRSELELKAVGMTISFDAIRYRDEYFAGAYPFCADVLPNTGCQILTRDPKIQTSIEIAAALANIKNQCGNILYTAIQAYHGDLGAVWEQIVGTRHCNRLVEAGALLPD